MVMPLPDRQIMTLNRYAPRRTRSNNVDVPKHEAFGSSGGRRILPQFYPDPATNRSALEWECRSRGMTLGLPLCPRRDGQTCEG